MKEPGVIIDDQTTTVTHARIESLHACAQARSLDLLSANDQEHLKHCFVCLMMLDVLTTAARTSLYAKEPQRFAEPAGTQIVKCAPRLCVQRRRVTPNTSLNDAN